MKFVRHARLLAIAALLVATSAYAQDSTKRAAPKALQTRVWVNSSSKVYHCPGSDYYGKTKIGEFMEEAQARAFGNRAVNGRACGNAAKSGRAPLPDTSSTTKKLVWVNTESGIYHCPNSSDWGMTQRGKYLSESDASAAKYKPAAGKRCAVN